MSTDVRLGAPPSICVPTPKRRPLALVLNRFIVALYRAVGFLVLTAILLGLVSFLFTKVFYLANRTWIAPTLLSATDERIVRLKAEIVQQSMLRDRLVLERASLEVNLRDAQRRAAAGSSLTELLTRAALNEARARRGERERLVDLTSTLNRVRGQVDEATRQFSAVSRQTLEEQYQAGLATRDHYVAGGLQLGQLAQTNLALEEKASDLAARRDQMKRDADALRGAALGSDPAKAHLNIDSLRLRQDYTRATLEVDRAADDIGAYSKALVTTDQSIARYDDLLRLLSEAPLLRALSGSITVAFVPYENLANAHVGSPVFACRLGMVVCRKVGQVNQILTGEVNQHSPVDSKNERGLMLELTLLGGEKAAQNQVLFLNHAPFRL